MANRGLAPRNVLNVPTIHIPFFENFPQLWEQFEGELASIPEQGLSVYEDKKNVYIEAQLPGLRSDDVEVTLDRGILWIKGEKKEEEENKDKKFYRKAISSFSYRVALPGQLDEKTEPKTSFKDGILKLTFQKSPQAQTKKIAIK